jgi:nitrogenase molybdenum-iron protein beta chain
MQKVDDIKPCYPLFRQDEYKDSLKNKKEKFEEGHDAAKVQERSPGPPRWNIVN